MLRQAQQSRKRKGVKAAFPLFIDKLLMSVMWSGKKDLNKMNFSFSHLPF